VTSTYATPPRRHPPRGCRVQPAPAAGFSSYSRSRDSRAGCSPCVEDDRTGRNPTMTRLTAFDGNGHIRQSRQQPLYATKVPAPEQQAKPRPD